MKQMLTAALIACTLLFSLPMSGTAKMETGEYQIYAEQTYSNQINTRSTSAGIKVDLRPIEGIEIGAMNPFIAVTDLPIQGETETVKLWGDLYCDYSSDNKLVYLGNLTGHLRDSEFVSLDVYYCPEKQTSNFGLAIGDGSQGHDIRFYGEYDPVFNDVLDKYQSYQQIQAITKQSMEIPYMSSQSDSDASIVYKSTMGIYGGGGVCVGSVHTYMTKEVIAGREYSQYVKADFVENNFKKAVENSVGGNPAFIQLPRLTQLTFKAENIDNRGQISSANCWPPSTNSSELSVGIPGLEIAFNLGGRVVRSFDGTGSAVQWVFTDQFSGSQFNTSGSSNTAYTPVGVMVKGTFHASANPGQYAYQRGHCQMRIQYLRSDGTSGSDGLLYSIYYSNDAGGAVKVV